MECRKTKTKVIILANHNRCKQHNEPIRNSKQIHIISAKRGKMRLAKTRCWFWFGFPLVEKVSFANQSQSVAMQNQPRNYFRQSIENRFIHSIAQFRGIKIQPETINITARLIIIIIIITLIVTSS